MSLIKRLLIETFMNKIEELAKNKIEDGIKYIKEKLNEMIIFIDNIPNKIYNNFLLLFEKEKKIINFKNYSENLKEKINRIIPQIINIISLIKSKVNENINIFIEKLEKLDDKEIEKIKENLSNLLEKNIIYKLYHIKWKIKDEAGKIDWSIALINLLTLTLFDEEANKAKWVINKINYSLSDKIYFICKMLKEIFNMKINDYIIIMKYIKQDSNFGNIKKIIKNMQFNLNFFIEVFVHVLKKIMINSNKIINFLTKKIAGHKKSLFEKINSNNIIYRIKDEIIIKYDIIKKKIMAEIEIIRKNLFKILCEYTKKIKSNFDNFGKLLNELVLKIEKYFFEKYGIEFSEIKKNKNTLKDIDNEKNDTELVISSEKFLIDLVKKNINKKDIKNNINKNHIVKDFLNEEKNSEKSLLDCIREKIPKIKNELAPMIETGEKIVKNIISLIILLKEIIDKNALFKNDNIFYFLNNELMEFENCFKKDISYIGKKSFSHFSFKYFFLVLFFCLFGIIAGIFAYKYVRILWIIVVLFILFLPLILFLFFTAIIYILQALTGYLGYIEAKIIFMIFFP